MASKWISYAVEQVKYKKFCGVMQVPDGEAPSGMTVRSIGTGLLRSRQVSAWLPGDPDAGQRISAP
jgi:hypothetical protein